MNAINIAIPINDGMKYRFKKLGWDTKDRTKTEILGSNTNVILIKITTNERFKRSENISLFRISKKRFSINNEMKNIAIHFCTNISRTKSEIPGFCKNDEDLSNHSPAF